MSTAAKITNKVTCCAHGEAIMTSTAAAQTSTITITSITKYRALFLVLAGEQGWSFTQVATNVDQYKKGSEVVTLNWGATQLKGLSHTKGKTMVSLVEGAKGAKLQRAQSAMGKPMELTAKWGKLSPAKVAELEALALATFQVITPKV